MGASDELVALLLEGHDAIPVLESLDQRDLITKVLPEWEPVRARPQRNAYHRFTVDRHLWEAAANAAELAPRVHRPDLLVLGALLHDLGKGYPGDHSVVGVELVERIGHRMGLAAADIEVLQSLVRLHLLLPDVATRRDLSDDATISGVAAAVGSQRVLELLAALTEADSLATGPSAWGSWKAELVEELVERVSHVLGGGELSDATWSLFPSELVTLIMGERRTVVLAEGDRVTTVAPDRTGLFSRVAGVLSIHGLDVLGAQAHSDEQGMAANEFRVIPPRDGLIDWTKVAADLERAIDGQLAIEARLAERARTYRRRRSLAAATVGPARCASTTRPRPTPPWSRCGPRTGWRCCTASPRPSPTWAWTSATPASRRSGRRWSTRSTSARPRARSRTRITSPSWSERCCTPPSRARPDSLGCGYRPVGRVRLVGVEDEATDVDRAGPVDFTRDLIRWSESLAGIARTGLSFTQSLYERERYEEILKVAADIKVAADDALEVRREQDHFVQEWLDSVGEGVPGYVTPKVAVGAIVGDDEGRLLLVQRADSGIWLYPTGWADVGYSAVEVALKEVREETGVLCEPVQLLGVIDGLRMGFTRFGMYMVLFHCRAVGGELQAHPLETSGVGWFGPDELPRTTGGASWWGPMAFAAIRGERMAASYDPPRPDVWRDAACSPGT